MPLLANYRLGPYEIKSAIGVGGMGEVYRAHDSRLNRDVAIKVLREDAASGPGQRSRFEREAQALAALNHPNIVVVHDFGFDNGQPYIVSEIIEGESLRALLDGKPVPARKLVDIAAQIADGLAAAHAAGIVHRDLKPENVMVARDGRVKILDFGLARQTAPVGSEETMGLDATQHVTREGAVVGTASYMSPEQAAGKPIDYRTDQFSLGLILYELASGHRAFSGPSAVETMAAIVRDDPPPIEEKLPAPLRWIMDRCLAKEPEQRYESTRDLYRDLRSLRDHFSDAWSSGSSSVGLAPVPAARKHSRWLAAVVAGAVCLIVGGLLAWIYKPVGQQIGNYRYTPFAAHAFGATWSPDGKAVAYSARVNGVFQTFLRYLDSPVPIQLTRESKDTGVEGWSSDRNHLIVFQSTNGNQGKLESVATVGGDLEFLMNVSCIVCDVSRDGKAFAELAQGPNPGDLWNVYISDPIGSPLRVYAPAPFASRQLYNRSALVFSPDGKKILLIITGDNRKHSAWVLPLPAGSHPPRQVLRNLPMIGSEADFSWLPDNRHIVISLQSAQDAPEHLWVADTESDDLEPLTTGSQLELDPTLSPNGKRLLYSRLSASYNLLTVSLSDGSASTLESTGRDESMPAWAADSSELAWVSDRNGPYEIWLRSADGSERPVVTAAQFPDGMNRWFMNPALSPDGKTLAFARNARNGVCRLWIMSLAGGSPVRLTNLEPEAEYGGAWSPDGSRFAYLQASKTGFSLMVVRASGDASPIAIEKIKTKGDYLPAWSSDGKWITWHDVAGWHLVSPDGKISKFLGDLPTPYLAFSKDGKLLYGIQTVATTGEVNPFDNGSDRAILFSIDPATLRQHVIRDLGKDLAPKSNFNPGLRFSLSPDGKSIVYSTGRRQSNLWMLQGFQLPGGFWQF